MVEIAATLFVGLVAVQLGWILLNVICYAIEEGCRPGLPKAPPAPKLTVAEQCWQDYQHAKFMGWRLPNPNERDWMQDLSTWALARGWRST